jgi:CrcB protein
MTPVLFIAAAATGAVLRLLVGLVTCSWQALLVVNVAGSAALAAIIAADLSTATVTVLGVGLCGALTTYSSFAMEVRSLGWRWGSVYMGITMVCVTTAASIGTSLVR